MYHNIFIHSSVNGHLNCFHVVNSSAVNNGIHVSISILVSSEHMHRSGIAEYMVVLFLVFQGISILSSIMVVYQFTFPPTVQEFSLFSTPSPAFIVCRHFDDGHSVQYKEICHYSFDLHFSNNERC